MLEEPEVGMDDTSFETLLQHVNSSVNAQMAEFDCFPPDLDCQLLQVMNNSVPMYMYHISV